MIQAKHNTGKVTVIGNGEEDSQLMDGGDDHDEEDDHGENEEDDKDGDEEEEDKPEKTAEHKADLKKCRKAFKQHKNKDTLKDCKKQTNTNHRKKAKATKKLLAAVAKAEKLAAGKAAAEEEREQREQEETRKEAERIATLEEKAEDDPAWARATYCSKPSARKEIHDVTDEEFEKFAAAVNKLKKRGDWEKIISFHHENGRHGSPNFLSWHHGFLNDIECLMRVAILDDSLFIPYWNWAMEQGTARNSAVWGPKRMGSLNENDDDARGAEYCVKDGAFGSDTESSSFTGDDCIKRDGSFIVVPQNWMSIHLAIAGRNRCGCKWEQQSSGWVCAPVYCTGKDQDTEVQMSRYLEGSLHNSVHVAIGGQGGHMSRMRSPYDPVFFMHHGFVDYMWQLWREEVGLSWPPPPYSALTHITTARNPNAPPYRYEQDDQISDHVSRFQSSKWDHTCPNFDRIKACLLSSALDDVKIPRVSTHMDADKDQCNPENPELQNEEQAWLAAMVEMEIMDTDESETEMREFNELANGVGAKGGVVPLDDEGVDTKTCSRHLCISTTTLLKECRVASTLKKIFAEDFWNTDDGVTPGEKVIAGIIPDDVD